MENVLYFLTAFNGFLMGIFGYYAVKITCRYSEINQIKELAKDELDKLKNNYVYNYWDIKQKLEDLTEFFRDDKNQGLKLVEEVKASRLFAERAYNWNNDNVKRLDTFEAVLRANKFLD